MKSRYVYLVALPLVIIFWSFSSGTLGTATVDQTSHLEQTHYIMGPVDNPDFYNPRYFNLATLPQDSFITFKESIAFKESQGKFWRVNSLGYLGKYQFGMSTLSMYGVNDSTLFLSSPNLQERIFIKNLRYNYSILEPYIKKYEGKKVGGIHITESGVLAAAHLSGPGGVKRFFKTNGRKSNRDAYGSSITTYMKRFAGYDLSTIVE